MSISSSSSMLLVIDFGSQVSQLIVRRIREIGVYCEIVPFGQAEAAMARLKPGAIILSGSPCSVMDEEAPQIPACVFESGVPVLGICYGQQAMSAQLGGKVEGGHHREFGRADLQVCATSPLFDGTWEVGKRYPVWMSHGDRVTHLPPGFHTIAHSLEYHFPTAIADETRRYYGVQFHPELVHTPQGSELLANFALRIAGLSPNWTMASFKERAIARLRDQVGEGRVLCGLSGGVDSAVTAVLLHAAIGDRLNCVLVDHGLLRKREAQEIVDLFNNHFHIPLVVVEAADLFLSALAQVEDPEKKRKIIGGLFIDVFEKEAKRISEDGKGPFHFLAQGTLYPDVIESVSFTGGPSVTIKSHHNVGGLPERMHLTLVEPLRDLFKDDVRRLGHELGLPAGFIHRHPFPGPGLAIRCPGGVTAEKLRLLREADAIYLDEIRKAGLYDQIWQAFAVLLPVRTVGVMGDGRTYDYVCALRAVTSVDGMSADFYPFDMSFLGQAARRIINEVPGINRIVYDVTSKPPGTIEWE